MKILVHIPKLTSNYLKAILVLNNGLPNNFQIKVYYPCGLKDVDKKIFYNRLRRRNLRLALNNNDIFRFMVNKGINFLYKKYSFDFENKKWNFIDDYFNDTQIELLRGELKKLNIGQRFFFGDRVTIECIKNINSCENDMALFNPDLFLMIGGPFVEGRILNRLRRSVNCHLGILPFYRGSKTVEWSILKNEPNNIGLTYHFMNHNIDDGQIIEKIYFKEAVDQGVGYVHAKLFELAFERLCDVVIMVVSDCVPRQEVLSHSSSSWPPNNYYYGYMLNGYHYKKLLRMCSYDV